MWRRHQRKWRRWHHIKAISINKRRRKWLGSGSGVAAKAAMAAWRNQPAMAAGVISAA